MELSSLLSDTVNVVDIYLCQGGSDDAPWVSVGWDKPITVPTTFGKGTVQSLIEYHHRELCYVYDTSNDGQRVLKRNLISHKMIGGAKGRFSGYAFFEEQLPSHQFPCVDEMTHKQQIQRTMYRINNRLSFIVDHEADCGQYYFYVRYQHAPNVDEKKMESDVKFALNQIRRVLM